MKTLSSIKNKILMQKQRIVIYLATIIIISFILVLNLSSITKIYSLYFFKHDTPRLIIRENGIPLVDYGYHYNEYLGQVEQPVTIQLAALNYYEQFLNGNTTSINYFNNCINWLINNMKSMNYYNVTSSQNQQYFLWEYDFTVWGLEKPWYSAMAQGLGIQLFSYAYKLTNDSTYIELIDKTLTSFFINTNQGGVRDYFYTTQGIWFPEYVKIYDSNYNPYFILNGFIIAIRGCYYAYETIPNDLLLDVFETGIKTLKEVIQLYDTGTWSYYHLKDNGKSPNYATLDYHMLHIDLLNELYDISNVTEFKLTAEKWALYTDPPETPKIQIFPLNLSKILFGGSILVFELLLGETLNQLVNLYKKQRRKKNDI